VHHAEELRHELLRATAKWLREDTIAVCRSLRSELSGTGGELLGSVFDVMAMDSNQDGDCLAATLRPGNVPSAKGWEEVLLPIIDRLRDQQQTVVVRADAAFALPAIYEALDLPVRPRGRPSHAPLVRDRSFQYQAASPCNSPKAT
jgi:hypothetical protein